MTQWFFNSKGDFFYFARRAADGQELRWAMNLDYSEEREVKYDMLREIMEQLLIDYYATGQE